MAVFYERNHFGKKIFINWFFSLFEMKNIQIVDICIFKTQPRWSE